MKTIRDYHLDIIWLWLPKWERAYGDKNTTYQVPLRYRHPAMHHFKSVPNAKVLGDTDHHRPACMYIYIIYIGIDRHMICETRCHNKLHLINIRGTKTSLQLVFSLRFHTIPSVLMRPSAEKTWFSNRHREILILQHALGLCRDGQTRMSTVDMVKPECHGQTPDIQGLRSLGLGHVRQSHFHIYIYMYKFQWTSWSHV